MATLLNNSNYSQGMQNSISECNMLNIIPDGLQQQKTILCQLKTGIWGYSLHGLTTIGQKKSGKLLPGVITVNFH